MPALPRWSLSPTLPPPTLATAAGQRIPNFAGVKYTCATVHEYQTCTEMDGGHWDVLQGTDEMLLSALAVGCRGAVPRRQ